MIRRFMLLSLAAALFSVVATLSPGLSGKASAACGKETIVLGIPTWHKYLDETTEGDGSCSPTIRKVSGDGATEGIALAPIALAVIEGAVAVGAIVAFIMVLWGAFSFIISQGDSGSAASARKTVQNSMIGLVIMLLSTRVVAFIGGRFL